MKTEKILMILVPILFVVLAIISYLKLTNNDTDALKFKKEYEALNGESKDIEISERNPIKYSNYDEVLDIIDNKTGVIYLGFPKCPWCRTAIPVLFDVAKDNNIDTIYYLNIQNDRDSYTVKDGELTYALNEDGKEIKGTEEYFKLLEALSDHLSDYVISVDDKEYEVGEKRIFAPTIVFVKNGKILGTHVSTVTSQKSGNDKLNEKQYEELYSIYEDFIIELNSSNDTCSLNSSC